MSTSGCFSDSEDFKPSDLQDPNKVQFLNSLAQRIWKFHKKSTLNDSELSSKLLKILSPPDDYNESTAIKPKKKNIFSSSSFYSSALHPTVEDQVNLARQISHSLSDAGNKQSRGQSMYVNRKKRSTKWVHDGLQRSASETFETNYDKRSDDCYDKQDRDEYHQPKEKSFFELIMDPRGHVKDIHSLVEQGDNVEHSPLSPEICLEIVKDLNSPKGKGAELFAKRRKKSEKWVVNETYGMNDSSHSSSTDFVDYEMPEASSEQKDNLLYEEFPIDEPKYTAQIDANEPYHPKTYEFLKRIPTASNSGFQNQNCNFNTAARGWNQNLTVYHPVKFNEKNSNRNSDSPATFHHLLYTDY